MKNRNKSCLVKIMMTLALCGVLFTGVSCGNQTETEVAPPAQQRDTLYQVSTIGALNVGVFDGVVEYSTLKQHGDCGIGSFTGLDGEMVAVDGRFYQVRTDGVPVLVSDGQMAPFALVTFFDNDFSGTPPAGLDYAGLQEFANGLLLTPNFFYAVRVDGEFSYLKIRSVPGQRPPFPPLSDVVAQQTVWELENVKGTMIGFFSPSYVGSIDPPGYHLHFISEDGRHGGHVLDCRTGAVTLKLDETDVLDLHLPETEGFERAPL